MVANDRASAAMIADYWATRCAMVADRRAGGPGVADGAVIANLRRALRARLIGLALVGGTRRDGTGS
jgi:hypothetical protein